MPSRSQVRIRRDLNRLAKLVEEQATKQPSLKAIQLAVETSAQFLNDRWQDYQNAAVAEDKEREERDVAAARVSKWTQCWRPVILLQVPGAQANLRVLPPSGATLDDRIRVAKDLRALISRSPGAASFREAALAALGTAIEDAEREGKEASKALATEDDARDALTEASLVANNTLVRGLEIVRAVFGPRSPEARQFRLRAAAGSDSETEAVEELDVEELEAEEDEESELGES